MYYCLPAHFQILDGATFAASFLPQLIARGNLTTDNTIGIVFGILTFVLGILSVAFTWAMWLLKRQDTHRRRRHEVILPQGQEDEEFELQRIARDHHGNYVAL